MTFQLGKINKLKNIVSLKVKLVGIDNQTTVTLEHCDSLLVSKSQAYCSVWTQCDSKVPFTLSS